MAIVEPKTDLAPIRSASMGMAPANWSEAISLADRFAKSQMVPKQYQNRAEDVLVAMAYGAEVGLLPMAALQSVAVINGKPGLHSDGFLAVIMAAPAYVAHREFYLVGDGVEANSLTQADLLHDTTCAVAHFWRRGISAPFVAEFSIADAKRARLWNKAGPWQEYPARMLKWRAREFAGRDAFAPELRGFKTAEALADEDLPVIEAPIIAPVRRSEKRAAAPLALTMEPDAPPPEPPAPPEPRGFDLPSTAKPAPPIRDIKPPAILASDSVVITDTAYVSKGDEEPFYEVRARVEAEGQAPIAYVFLTRDKSLFDLAASAEGSKQTFSVTWRTGKRQDGSACKILESIEAC